jgi:hypothetical protein
MPKYGFPETEIYVEKIRLIRPVARAIENNNSWPAPRRRGYNVPGDWNKSSQQHSNTGIVTDPHPAAPGERRPLLQYVMNLL